jgi:hypothetical protein
VLESCWSRAERASIPRKDGFDPAFERNASAKTTPPPIPGRLLARRISKLRAAEADDASVGLTHRADWPSQSRLQHLTQIETARCGLECLIQVGLRSGAEPVQVAEVLARRLDPRIAAETRGNPG